MNNIYTRMFLAAVAFISLAGCSGAGDGEELQLLLMTDVASFPADGQSKVTFSVFEGNADVTSNAVIYESRTEKPLENSAFSTSQAGEYYFYAQYKGKQSEQVKVTAEAVVETRFVRNICLMEFTDGSCSFCPDASRYIDRNILGKNENVHLMAFHEKDEWKSDQFAELFSKFELTGTPGASVDMRGGLSLETGERDNVRTAIAESGTRYPTHCAVSVESSLSGQNAAVSVTLFSELSEDYYLAVYVVEDGIKGYQLDGSIEYDDYYHQFVVRKMLSASVYGDALGRVAAQTEKTKEYSIACGSDWNLAKTYVYALAVDKNGYVNNMQVCLLDGGSAGYEYLK